MDSVELKKILEAHREWKTSLGSAGARADLGGADLRGADLGGADLRGADLRGADLGDTKFDDLSKIAAIFPRSPRSFFVPTMVHLRPGKKLRGDVIAELLIPSDAKRTSSLVGRKCRAEFAQVITLHGTADAEAFDLHSGKLIYKVGETVRPDSYNDDFRLECTNGIHFYITRREAEEHS